jgi:ribosome-associated protein
VRSPRAAAPTDSDRTTLNTIEFKLDREHVQINNLFKLTGLAGSGGAGKALVAAGGVTVDGQPESRKTAKIKVGQVVHVGDTEIRVIAP